MVLETAGCTVSSVEPSPGADDVASVECVTRFDEHPAVSNAQIATNPDLLTTP
jgi:hypothetical protein